MRQRVGYVDEAFDECVYILACVIDDGSHGDEPRLQLRDLLLGRQRQLHFAKESAKRRQLIAETVARLELPAIVAVRPSPEPNERRRGQCLVALAWAVAEHVDELVLEARQQRLNDRDTGVLAGIATHGPNLPAQFVSAEQAEPLWAADAVAGAMFADLRRGVRTYRAALDFVLTVIET